MSDKILHYHDTVWIINYENNILLKCIDRIGERSLTQQINAPRLISFSQFWVDERQREIGDQILAHIKQQSQEVNWFLSLIFVKFERHMHSEDLWVIEGEQIHRGGLIMKANRVRLKCPGNGMYLAVRDMQGECVITMEDPGDDELDQDQFFVLEEMEDRVTDTLEYQSFYYIRHLGSGKYLGVQDVGGGAQYDYYDAQDDLGALLEKEHHLQQNLAIRSLVLKQSVSESNILKIYRNNDISISKNRFLLSCKSIISEQELVLQRNLESFLGSTGAKSGEIFNNRYQKVNKQVKKLHVVLRELQNLCTQDADNELGIAEKSVNSQNQRMINEQGLIPVIVNLLRVFLSPTMTREIQKHLQEANVPQRLEKSLTLKSDKGATDEKTLHRLLCEKVIKLAQEIYATLRKVCANNYENEKACGKYFEIFKDHINISVGSITFMTQIIENNEELLNTLSLNFVESNLHYLQDHTHLLQFKDMKTIEDCKLQRLRSIAAAP